MTEALNRDYTVSSEIGRGTFGVVYLCHSISTGQCAAVKSIEKRLVQKDKNDALDRQCLYNETKITKLASGHQNVVQILDVYEDEKFLHIVLEYCGAGELYDLIQAKGRFSEAEALAIMVPLMESIAHCHARGVAHRDIKPENILFNDCGDLKLVDFGWGECFRQGVLMSGVVGTPYYMAPEVLTRRVYNEKVDVWSAGVILYILLTGTPPFEGESTTETFEAVIRGNLRFPKNPFGTVSWQVKGLLKRMLCKDVSRRFSADEVLKHPWMLGQVEFAG